MRGQTALPSGSSTKKRGCRMQQAREACTRCCGTRTCVDFRSAVLAALEASAPVPRNQELKLGTCSPRWVRVGVFVQSSECALEGNHQRTHLKFRGRQPESLPPLSQAAPTHTPTHTSETLLRHCAKSLNSTQRLLALTAAPNFTLPPLSLFCLRRPFLVVAYDRMMRVEEPPCLHRRQ